MTSSANLSSLLAGLLVASVTTCTADVYIQRQDQPFSPPPAGVLTVTNYTNPDDPHSFDSYMRTNVGPGTVVWLGKGTFVTKGVWNGSPGVLPTDPPGFRLQNGCQLHGFVESGSRQTTLQLVATRDPTESVVVATAVVDGLSNVGVTDLIIDCNAQTVTQNNANPATLEGISLWGRNLTISNVEVIRSSNKRTDPLDTTTQESWIVSENANSGTSAGNLIYNCFVHQFYNPTGNGGCSAISLNQRGTGEGYITGVIEACGVILGENAAGFGGEFAYNA